MIAGYFKQDRVSCHTGDQGEGTRCRCQFLDVVAQAGKLYL